LFYFRPYHKFVLQMDETDYNLKRFRIFKLGNGFEVWVGKDSAANDLLSMKYSAQNDLWFHVRGASGSHTVLKIPEGVRDIPKDIIKTAASIAAFYSRAKNAKNVPVAYTLAKNVQKYKGAKSGSVVIKSEKIVKVEPGVPED
jgi:predicted ribosome quality control (RQC) complex YloA/Tae2 family protein